MSRQTKSLSSKFLRGLNFFLLIVFAFLCVYPLYFIFINSISGADAVVRGVYLLPEDFSLEFYKSLLQMPNIPNSIVVSVARTVLGTALTVICSSFLGYMVTQSELPMRKWVYRFVVATMYFNAGLIPWYMVITQYLGMLDSLWALIVPSLLSSYNILLMRNFIKQCVPGEVVESARIDGAGDLRIFLRIVLQLSTPALATIGLFIALGKWNDWYSSMLFIKTESRHTLQYYLYRMVNMANAIRNMAQAGVSVDVRLPSETLKMAMAIVATGPVVLVYPFVQRYFVKGLSIGAVKG